MGKKKFLRAAVLVTITALMCIFTAGCGTDEKKEVSATEEVSLSYSICPEYMETEGITAKEITDIFSSYGLEDGSVTVTGDGTVTVTLTPGEKSEILKNISDDSQKAVYEFSDIKEGYKLIYYTSEYRADIYCDTETPEKNIQDFVKRVKDNMAAEDILYGNADEYAVKRSRDAETGEIPAKITVNLKSCIDGSPVVFPEEDS